MKRFLCDRVVHKMPAPNGPMEHRIELYLVEAVNGPEAARIAEELRFRHEDEYGWPAYFARNKGRA